MVENFYGDKKYMIVHDLSGEKPKCEISEIKLVHKRYFMPDTLEQAKSEGYEQCGYCCMVAPSRIVFKDKIGEEIEEQKMRIKASKADRRSGGSKTESKIKKSKARTKEVRSQKKIATVRKRRS